MELAEKQLRTPTRSWASRAKRKQIPKVDYYLELKRWLQLAITEAEKDKTSAKRLVLNSSKSSLKLSKNGLCDESKKGKGRKNLEK